MRGPSTTAVRLPDKPPLDPTTGTIEGWTSYTRLAPAGIRVPNDPVVNPQDPTECGQRSARRATLGRYASEIQPPLERIPVLAPCPVRERSTLRVGAEAVHQGAQEIEMCSGEVTVPIPVTGSDAHPSGKQCHDHDRLDPERSDA